MSEFDEIFEKNYGFYIDDSCKHRYANSKEFGKAMYEAGQQSQQAKIDELQNKLDSLQHTANEVIGATFMSCASYLSENNKLRKAIDDIKNHLQNLSEKHVSTHAYLGFLDILDILKVNKDE